MPHETANHVLSEAIAVPVPVEPPRPRSSRPVLVSERTLRHVFSCTLVFARGSPTESTSAKIFLRFKVTLNEGVLQTPPAAVPPSRVAVVSSAVYESPCKGYRT